MIIFYSNRLLAVFEVLPRGVDVWEQVSASHQTHSVYRQRHTSCVRYRDRTQDLLLVCPSVHYSLSLYFISQFDERVGRMSVVIRWSRLWPKCGPLSGGLSQWDVIATVGRPLRHLHALRRLCAEPTHSLQFVDVKLRKTKLGCCYHFNVCGYY